MSSANAAHPSAESLQAFGLGRLDRFSAEPIKQHLETCAACRLLVANLSRSQPAGIPSLAPSPTRPVSQGMEATGLGSVPAELRASPQYDILRLLGRGGMGVVYLARNKLMDRLEVLKVINQAMMDRADSLDRFLREIRAAAKLNHVNVVKAYSAIQLGEILVFAMEYVEGEDLAQYVRSHGPLPVPNACYYARQVAQGLQHAFEKDMVHRDIKPQNLILARDGKKHIVKILDFGLAKATSEKRIERELTGLGRMLGTPEYMAPEQMLDASNADIRADIYSLGCTLYFMLSGAPCFQAASLLELLQAHQSAEPKPLNLVRPDVPVELAQVVGRMMAKDPARRYQTPAEVAQALKGFIKQGAKDGETGSGPAASLEDVPGNQATASLPRAQGWSDQRITRAPSITSPPPLYQTALAEPRGKSVASWVWLGAGSITVAVAGVLFLTCAGLIIFFGMRPPGTTTTGTNIVQPPPPPVKDGVLVLQQMPAGAEVLVDGQLVPFNWPGAGLPVEISAKPGNRTVEVRKTGYKSFTTNVTVADGGRHEVQIWLDPVIVNPPPQPIGTNVFMSQALVRVTDIADKFKAVNFKYNQDISILGGWVDEKASLNWNAQFTAGVEYMCLACGDNDAQDVRLAIMDSNGTTVATDQLIGNHATVTFTPQFSGTYTLRLTLFQSRNSFPCVCVTTILKKNGWAVPVGNIDQACNRITARLLEADKAAQLIGQRVDLHRQANQWAFFGGVVQQGQALGMRNLNLGIGKRVLVGAGDDFVKVVNLDLLDSNQKAILQDFNNNPVSLLEYSAGGGTHGLQVYNIQSNGPAVCLMAVFDYVPKK